MLVSLYIKSFVIIDEVSVDFAEGMSVLTGETGAGKSIIIDALGQLCGNRSSSALVRKGEKKAIIQGTFEVERSDALEAVFDEIGLDFDEQIQISKEIFASGKSTIKINYRPMTNAALKRLAPYLLHIHSQFETQSLFNIKNHLSILDTYVGDSLNKNKAAYQDVYKKYVEAARQIKKIQEEDFSDERIEYYQAQYDELKDLEYTDEDVDNLEKELDVMKNFESMSESIKTFDEALDGHGGGIEALSTALNALESIKDVEGFSESYDTLYNLYYNVMDVHDQVMNQFNGYDFDEYRFNEVQEILFHLQRLKRKYGYSMDDLYQARDELANKINAALHREDVINELNKKKDNYYIKAQRLAKELHKTRSAYAKRFEEQIHEQLRDLYLEHARFQVDFQQVELGSEGYDQVTFMVAMNKGQNFTALNESASGGEISRLMLAIKTIILTKTPVDTVIFDEVDTGVSGKVASSIGEKMAELAKSKQVICITHLPQVAVCATHHYAIAKAAKDAKTYSHMRLLSDEERVEEIAKMLSGEDITSEAMENAKRLLQKS